MTFLFNAHQVYRITRSSDDKHLRNRIAVSASFDELTFVIIYFIEAFCNAAPMKTLPTQLHVFS